tara:strand:+ start:7473 stop:7730 length:258 start_codon:yes stop_codon:yes gene_type:complete
MENYLEIIVSYWNKEQDTLTFDGKDLDLNQSASNWILENLHKIVDAHEFEELAKLSCCLYYPTANEQDLFIQDLIKTNGKFYFNQ